jgi:site-specific recombinase XerD
MTDMRQLPLFPTQPRSAADLNPYTSLRDSVMLFQQHLFKEGKSRHTVAAFTADLHFLAEYLGENMPLGKYTTGMLNEFMSWLEYGRGVPCSRKSYARRVTTLKVFFKWLHSLGAIPHDPAIAVLQRSGPAPLAVILTPDEVQEAIFFARTMERDEQRDTRPEMLFRLILDTGIKKGEAMRLIPDDVDQVNPERPLLTIRHQNAHDALKDRRILLDPGWVRLLDEYLAQYMPVQHICNCTARNLEYILEDIGQGAGIEAKVSFEMLRWTCAVRDYQAGEDPDAIREKLGLSRISWVETFGKIKRLAEEQEE